MGDPFIDPEPKSNKRKSPGKRELDNAGPDFSSPPKKQRRSPGLSVETQNLTLGTSKQKPTTRTYANAASKPKTPKPTRTTHDVTPPTSDEKPDARVSVLHPNDMIEGNIIIIRDYVKNDPSLTGSEGPNYGKEVFTLNDPGKTDIYTKPRMWVIVMTVRSHFIALPMNSQKLSKNHGPHEPQQYRAEVRDIRDKEFINPKNVNNAYYRQFMQGPRCRGADFSEPNIVNRVKGAPGKWLMSRPCGVGGSMMKPLSTIELNKPHCFHKSKAGVEGKLIARLDNQSNTDLLKTWFMERMALDMSTQPTEYESRTKPIQHSYDHFTHVTKGKKDAQDDEIASLRQRNKTLERNDAQVAILTASVEDKAEQISDLKKHTATLEVRIKTQDERIQTQDEQIKTQGERIERQNTKLKKLRTTGKK